ncbi:reverse transcriptase domain, Reverse transcriptase zinc-binding domain protein [Artemisia annua]|uniref:Reverse transcriptase domain, Reverse transcriptase zinc-binding domain protein n=1 Tax=Artemisia annua TaxID=35608 RepID=A0A2U1MX55_ARTAN|nr:reverse transcriptase domain, Reverse transcriptase zinc-binding domain protein [Artemisia annua]
MCNWMRDGSLKVIYPRLFALEENKEVSVRAKKNAKGGGAEGMQLEELTNKIRTFEFVENQDSWSWNLDGEGVFSVSSARRIIDDGLCVLDGSPTIWLKLIPIKVNILAWCLASNKLPTRFNMSLRGLEVSSIECHGGGGFRMSVFLRTKAGYLVSVV